MRKTISKRLFSIFIAFTLIFSLAVIIPGDKYSFRVVATDTVEGKKVVQVALGGSHSACITEDGCLYTWGFNHNGQLGDGTNDYRNIPTKIMDNVKQVSLGYNHTACITEDGTLYTWGSNNCGQLGDGTKTYYDSNEQHEVNNNRSIPVKIMDNAKYVSLGGMHSACITQSGELYMWGNGYEGCLGFKCPSYKLTPEIVMENVAQVSLGYKHSACVTNDGSLYTWGMNNYGQLGDGTVENSFCPILIMDNVKQVDLGSVCSSCITCDNELYTWGYNLDGHLGTYSNDNVLIPQIIKNNITYVSLGDSALAYISNDSTLSICGSLNISGSWKDGIFTDFSDNILLSEKHNDVIQVCVGMRDISIINSYGLLFCKGDITSYINSDGNSKDYTKIIISNNEKDISTQIIIPDAQKIKETNNFKLERDNNSYIHSNGEGYGFYGRSNHIFSDLSYYNELLKNSSDYEKYLVLCKAASDWHGSCYGVTLSMALVNGGYVSLSDISDVNAKCYYNLIPRPDTDPRLSNMIEYYQLSQYISNGGTNAVIAEARRSNSFSSISLSDTLATISLPATLATMVDKASKNEPYLLNVGYRSMQTDDKGNKSEKPVGHTVLVLGCKETENSYDLIIYNCNHREDFEYLSVNKDLKSFKYNGFKVSDGNELTQDNYRYLQVTDLEKMKNTPVLSPNIKNLGKIENSPKTISKVQGAEMNADNTTTISFNMDSSFVLHSRSGKTLSYDGESLDGDITVLDVSITGDEKPYYTVVIENDEEYIIENNGTVIDLLIYYNNEFYSVESEGASRLIINNNGVTVSGQEYDYDAKAGVIIDGEPTLVSIKGNTSDSITISAKDNKTTVTSDNELNDIKVTSFSPSKRSENKYESVDNSFEINGKDASIVTNGSDNEFAPGDVNNDGKINVTDVSKTAAHVKGIRPLDENAQKRADVNGDNKINVTDIAKIAAHVKGIKPLS